MASEVMLEIDPQRAANIAANSTNHGEIRQNSSKEYEVFQTKTKKGILFENKEETWYATFTREPFGCKMRYPSKGSKLQDNAVEKMRDALSRYEV